MGARGHWVAGSCPSGRGRAEESASFGFQTCHHFYGRSIWVQGLGLGSGFGVWSSGFSGQVLEGQGQVSKLSAARLSVVGFMQEPNYMSLLHSRSPPFANLAGIPSGCHLQGTNCPPYQQTTSSPCKKSARGIH